MASVLQSVVVNSDASVVNTERSRRRPWSADEDIARTPGADQTNSLAMITDYVPGAYMTHDMLHMRGGHQVSWLIDGVQIPNTNIASNLAARSIPKISTMLRCRAAAIAPILAIAPTGSSMSFPAPGSAIAKGNSS